MKIPFIVFTRAIALYLLFTLPAMVLPFMYVYSAFLAVAFGAAAGMLFIGCYMLIAKCNIPYKTKFTVLSATVPIGVTTSYLLIGWLNAADGLWGISPFLVFPGVAVIAGWASLFISRKKIKEQFDSEEDELQLLLNQ